mmetsp:Transcript_91077/g.262568  ORF Transcript_91077/g.262568 Transcript_91077/m.262568 type:complete len:221 (-) Transcript_91077:120-782(-)|eukprot:CAMPEP_0176054024 /NCGR_PEP_ID=MMETSP0120_2-20121206/26877_1 /TAXON_ID=160619 /ORGANISM="Kryptoperidinium foliaceum, Strain CCMP 1326" /LENGTH=220 /DNA_ID=CAMNT_0017387487 /DNA_START=146 /DNA_END=808 /DNA_ORIENTATION=-
MASQDIENAIPAPVDSFKEGDDASVSTHVSDSDSDGESHVAMHSSRHSYRKLVLVAVFAAIIGLSVGLGLGLRVREEEEPARSIALTSDAGEDKVTGTAAEPTQPVVYTGNHSNDYEDETEDYEEKEKEEPKLETPEEENQPAPGGFSFGGIGGSSSLSWPELVGLPGEEAKKILEDLDEGYTVVIVPPDGATTKDLRMDRIFLYVNEEGYVERVPRPGR